MWTGVAPAVTIRLSRELDVSIHLVQNIKLADMPAIDTNDRVRMPRQPLAGKRRKMADKILRDALAVRPKLLQSWLPSLSFA